MAARSLFLLAALLAVVSAWRLAGDLGLNLGEDAWEALEGSWARWQTWFASALATAALAWTLSGGADAPPFKKDVS